MSRSVSAVLGVALLALGQGCAHKHHERGSAFGPCPTCPPDGRLVPVPGRPGPFVAPAPLPPGGPVPSGSFAPPVTTYPPGAPTLGGQPPVPTAPERAAWRPSLGPGARLTLPPGPGPGEIARDAARPPSPSIDSPPERDTPPVDVPMFVVLKDGVASGHKPFADGVSWLREKGYRTVLHVRPPGEDDAPARRQFEARGFRYVSLEVSPQTLKRETVEEFNRTVADAGNRPIFVYDRDGSLQGGLWYLHFRVADGLSRDQAVAKAAAVGLNPDAEAGPHREMWLAVQRYLEMGKV